nr:MspI family type II restriction endonuclease [Bacillus sp. T3]
MTNDIPKLPSNGQPKTDVLLIIKTNKQRIQVTFSCKRSSAKRVSIHQYKAESFIKVLNITDTSLKEAFLKFQECGGFKEMKLKYQTLFEYMKENLSKYNKKLTEWAYSGAGEKGILIFIGQITC